MIRSADKYTGSIASANSHVCVPVCVCVWHGALHVCIKKVFLFVIKTVLKQKYTMQDHVVRMSFRSMQLFRSDLFPLSPKIDQVARVTCAQSIRMNLFLPLTARWPYSAENLTFSQLLAPLAPLPALYSVTPLRSPRRPLSPFRPTSTQIEQFNPIPE